MEGRDAELVRSQFVGGRELLYGLGDVHGNTPWLRNQDDFCTDSLGGRVLDPQHPRDNCNLGISLLCKASPCRMAPVGGETGLAEALVPSSSRLEIPPPLLLCAGGAQNRCSGNSGCRCESTPPALKRHDFVSLQGAYGLVRCPIPISLPGSQSALLRPCRRR